MKHLITFLTIILLGISSCKNIANLETNTKPFTFEEIKQQILKEEADAPRTNAIPRKSDMVLPKVGDQVIRDYTYLDYEFNWTAPEIKKVFIGKRSFVFECNNGPQAMVVWASYKQIEVKTLGCTDHPANTFLTYKASIHETNPIFPEFEGIYDSKENKGCAPAKIVNGLSPDCKAPINQCPKVTPQIVAFHKESDMIMGLYWNTAKK